jgi:starch phosphorylase
MTDSRVQTVAYFSMEVALAPELPTYSGGLGILAGDVVRAAADARVPMVGVTLAHRKGYFRQHIDAAGHQSEAPEPWEPAATLVRAEAEATVVVGGRAVRVVAWRYDVVGHDGGIVPVYLLDTDTAENHPEDRRLTDALYGGGKAYRLGQEIVLGEGGVLLLDALLGADAIATYHMNEGHAALITVPLLQRAHRDLAAVRAQCVFTTHTPVPAGHDRFDRPAMNDVLGEARIALLDSVGGLDNGELDMTHLALQCTRYVNGVAMRHGEVSRAMFPGRDVRAITNGVHAGTWVSPAFAALYDATIPEWRGDNAYLRYAVALSAEQLRAAHAATKADLLALVAQRTGTVLDPSVLTFGFARRATAYKRHDLIFRDLDRLRRIVKRVGPLQIVYGGKAHPQDLGGKGMIEAVYAAARELGDSLRVVYLENYEMGVAKQLCTGVDVWLNTPQAPLEASGTSGMKAALNGVPMLSTRDGWWLEGHIEGVTGWGIGSDEVPLGADTSEADGRHLLDLLKHAIMPMFYDRPNDFAAVRRGAIAFNGSFFTTERMVAQYVRHAYTPPVRPEAVAVG